MKDFRCPFCLEKFNSRSFLLHVHVPRCQIRQDYFNQLLELSAMEEIKRRVDGEFPRVEFIKNEKFEGKAFPKEEI
jgi:hypothetical protein